MLEKIFPKLHQEGYKFLVISAFLTFILWFLSGFFSFIFLVITVWVYYFFRDPERKIIQNDEYLVSPADGVVSAISEVQGPIELGLENKKFTRVSIFMNLFDLVKQFTNISIHIVLCFGIPCVLRPCPPTRGSLCPRPFRRS